MFIFCYSCSTEESRGCMQRNNTLEFDTINKVHQMLQFFHHILIYSLPLQLLVMKPHARFPSVSRLDKHPFGPSSARHASDPFGHGDISHHKHRTPSLLQNICGYSVMCPSSRRQPCTPYRMAGRELMGVAPNCHGLGGEAA